MLNIKRSKQPIENFTYNDKKIVEIIKYDFYNLCYLCEERSPRHTQTDHYLPQKFYPDEENTWENLFYICEKCNNIKQATFNKSVETEILNCCKDDVENIISLSFNFRDEKIEIIVLQNSIKSKNTKILLEKIYNGIGSESNKYLDLQEEIKAKIEMFNQLLYEYEHINANDIKAIKKETIIKFIRKETNRGKIESFDFLGFVSFKRQIIKNNPKFEHFKQYFD